MYKFFFKRLLDILISGLALLAIGWLIVLIAIFLHFANKGAGAFFFQERPGKDEKLFKVIKFKTMTDERDADGKLLPDERRLTKVGKFVRSTSIDELPQLLNVIKGDMSLVGPRPFIPGDTTLPDMEISATTVMRNVRKNEWKMKINERAEEEKIKSKYVYIQVDEE